MVEKDFDLILSQLKTGRWNYLYFFGISLAQGLRKKVLSLVPANILGGAFISPAVNHSCIPEDPNALQVTECHFSHVKKSVNLTIDQLESTQCSRWQYDNSSFGVTLTSEFDLVCKKDYLRTSFHSLYMLGNLLAAPIIGYMADRYGRKTLLGYATTIYVLMALLISWLPDLTTILVGRFLLGLVHPGMVQISYILCLEVCEMKHRSIVGILISVPWAFGTIWWGVLGYLIRDWRWLQRSISLPALFILIFVWILDESPRWLIVRGQHKRASKILHKACKMNRSTLPPIQELNKIMQKIEKSALAEKERTSDDSTFQEKLNILSIIAIFRAPAVRKRVLLLFIYFFVVATVFYGMSLSAVNYSADPFIYMIIGGVVEIPAYILPIPIITKFGRRMPTSLFMFFCAFCLICIIFIPSDLTWLVITVAMMGRLCIAAAYQMIYLYAMELLPTEIRVLTLGSCNTVSRFGSIASPYITDTLGKMHAWIPSAIFGLLSTIAAISCIFLPETLNKSLPETIEQVEEDAIRQANKTKQDRSTSPNDSFSLVSPN